MNPLDEERLKAKLTEIMRTSSLTREAAINAVTETIISSYRVGLQMGIPGLQVDPLLTESSINAAVESMSRRTGQIWDQMDAAIINTITQGIKEGKSYDGVTADVDDLIRNGFGEKVHFDNRGKTVRDVKISPDGSMEWHEHTIKQPKTMTTEDYADDIARTVVHESWNDAKDDQFKSLDIPGWIYTAVLDGATRPTHLALHGKVIKYGTEDEKMAIKVQSDYRCRCTRIPWYDDPDFDDDPAKYEKQKQDAAQKAREDLDDDSAAADFLDALLGDNKVVADPVESFLDAESMQAIKATIKTKWNKRIKFGGGFNKMDLQTAKESFNALDEVINDFEGVAKDLSKFGVQQHSHAFATTTLYYRTEKSEINLCKDWYYPDRIAIYQDAFDHCVETHYHPKGTLSSVAVHEMGHAVTNTLAMGVSKEPETYSRELVMAAAKSLLEHKPTYREVKKLRLTISGYAAEDEYCETIAESFADYYANRDKAAPFSLEIMKHIKQRWDGRR